MKKIELTLDIDVENIVGGVLITVQIDNWIWTMKGRGHAALWPLAACEKLVRNEPHRFSSEQDGPALRDVIKLVPASMPERIRAVGSQK